MNKTFKKYGKVSFKSIVPRRLKRIRVMRISHAAVIAATHQANLSAMVNVNANGARKARAISELVSNSKLSIARAMTRSDHPIHKKAAN